jgi:hypothetical protein
MKKFLLLIALAALATSCASTSVTNGLTALQGKHIDDAVGVLGYPDGKTEFGDDTIYTWGHSSTSVIYSGFQAVPVHAQARIKIIAGNNGYIKTWEWSGNENGLQRYAGRLGEYARRNKTKGK